MRSILTAESKTIDDPFSASFREVHKLISKAQALEWIHFPLTRKHLEAARNRIKFEEFFFLQLTQQRNKMRNKTSIKGYTFEEVGDSFLDFYKNHLPFELDWCTKKSGQRSSNGCAHWCANEPIGAG